jgi:Raf kinase inhibitor-like YbhB/YbcL family protein
MNRILIVAIVGGSTLLSYAAEKEVPVAQFTLSSPNFRNNQPMLGRCTCEGIEASNTVTYARKDASPELKWEGTPAGTKSFAMICDDPDAPGGTWVHWLLYDIPRNTAELPLGIWVKDNIVGATWSPSRGTPVGWQPVAASGTVAGKLLGAKQGVNDFGTPGYGGPCPPRGSGVHHYHFRLFALDAELNLAARVTRQQLDAAMKGHILGQAELVGTYQRE